MRARIDFTSRLGKNLWERLQPRRFS